MALDEADRDKEWPSVKQRRPIRRPNASENTNSGNVKANGAPNGTSSHGAVSGFNDSGASNAQHTQNGDGGGELIVTDKNNGPKDKPQQSVKEAYDSVYQTTNDTAQAPTANKAPSRSGNGWDIWRSHGRAQGSNDRNRAVNGDEAVEEVVEVIEEHTPPRRVQQDSSPMRVIERERSTIRTFQRERSPVRPFERRRSPTRVVERERSPVRNERRERVIVRERSVPRVRGEFSPPRIVEISPRNTFDLRSPVRSGGTTHPYRSSPLEFFRVDPSASKKHGLFNFGRFDHFAASPVTVGQASFDKVAVDCKLLLSRTKWGTLGAGAHLHSDEVPAGIMYMDLTFHQPKKCRLSSATVYVMMDDQAPELDSFRQQNRPTLNRLDRSDKENESLPVQITPWFGPKAIVGRERTVQMEKQVKIEPTVGFAEATLGGMGWNEKSTKTQSSRWTFEGQAITDSPGSRRDGRGTNQNAGLCKVLRWSLAENDLESEASHNPVMHTAFTFVHSNKPVLLRIRIEGKLQGLRARARNKLQFPRDKYGKDGYAATIIDLSGQQPAALPLDQHARGLDSEMYWANYVANRVEMPDAMPASFQTVPPGAWGANNGPSPNGAGPEPTNQPPQPQPTGPSTSSRGVFEPPRRVNSLLTDNDNQPRGSTDERAASEALESAVQDLARSFHEIISVKRQAPARTDSIRVSPIPDLHAPTQEANGEPNVEAPSEHSASSSPHDAIEIQMPERVMISNLWRWILYWIADAILRTVGESGSEHS